MSSQISKRVPNEQEKARAALAVMLEEQKNISRMLHDGLGQQLTGIVLVSNLLLKEIEKVGGPSLTLGRQLSDLLGDARRQLRDVLFSLAPTWDAPQGLMAALERLTVDTNQLPRVVCRLECQMDGADIDQISAAILHRFAKAVIAHAIEERGARRLAVRLRMIRRRPTLIVEAMPVKNARRANAKSSLDSMLFMTRALGGFVRIKNAQGRPLEFYCSLPDTGRQP